MKSLPWEAGIGTEAHSMAGAVTGEHGGHGLPFSISLGVWVTDGESGLLRKKNKVTRQRQKQWPQREKSARGSPTASIPSLGP